MTPNSVVIHDDRASYGDLGNPFEECMKAVGWEERIVELSSPVDEDEKAKNSLVFVNRPQTPPTPEQTVVLPAELPGSILLPSQGFPQQNPPITPARDSYTSQYSEDYLQSRTPSLDTSSSTDGEMEIFKHLTSPPKRSVRANTFPVAATLNTSKPFSAMGAEELMDCLPELNMSVVSHSWVPAMENELKRIKALLQEAAEIRLQSQAGLENFGSVSLDSLESISWTNFSQDVNSIAVSARDISRTYFDAMQRVRPLADRDAKAINDRLDSTRTELETALAVVEENKNIISDKDDVIQRLHETIMANSRVLGGFIQDHIGSRLNNIHDIRTQDVKQLLNDQQLKSSENTMNTPARYLRIPETQYNSYLQNLHDAQQKVETYSRIVNEQLGVIKSQSADLDKRMEGYGECLTILENRHKRIVELESKVEATEKELRAAKENAETHQVLQLAHDKLTKQYSDLEWTLESLKNGFKKQLEDRDTEIFNLRQQLGDAVMAAAARKAEAQTAISQPEATASTGISSRFRNPLHFGRNQDRNLPIHARRGLLSSRLPASQSMLSLNTSQANLALDKHQHPAYRATPSPLSDMTTTTTPSADSNSDKGTGSSSGGRWRSGLRMNPPEKTTTTTPSSANSSTNILIPPRRPRNDSLRARTELSASALPTARGGELVDTAVRPSSLHLNIDRQKALPSPPPPPPPFSLAIPHRGNYYYYHYHHSAIDHHPHNHRVLSGITERSFEDTDRVTTATPTSTSSSDKNAFRSSMAVLERFHEDEDDDDEGMSSPSKGARIARSGIGGISREGGDKTLSPVRSTRELNGPPYSGFGHGLGYGQELRRGGRVAPRRGRGMSLGAGAGAGAGAGGMDTGTIHRP